MGEGTSEIRHLRERVLLHDDQLRGMGERIRLLDEMLHEMQKIVAPLVGGAPGSGGVPVVAKAAESRRPAAAKGVRK